MAHSVGSTGGHRSLGFFPGLEGLRGVAVLAILIFHADERWLPGGFLGVSTFFTLSGFLITRLLVAEVESTGRIDLRAFYARRLRRILPASLVALCGVALFGVFAADVTQLARLRSDGLSALFYVANWWLVASGSEYAMQMGSPSPIQHFWSLAIEEQFYLFFPWLVMVAMWRRRMPRTSLALLLAALTLAATLWTAWLESSGASSSRLYYGSDTRCGELFVGSLLALLWNRLSELGPGRRRAGIAALGVLGAAVSATFWATAHPHDVILYRGGLTLYAVASAAILAAALLPVGPIPWLLAWSPMRWLGRISYGAYLYHWPIFLCLDVASTGLEPVPLALLRVALTLLIAAVSHRLLERPIRDSGWWQGWRLSVGALTSAALVSLSFVWVTRDVAEPLMHPQLAEPVPVAGLRAAMPRELSASAEREEARAIKTAVIPKGRKHNRKRRVRVVVLGDSVAADLSDALARWASSRRKMMVQTLAARGCGIARMPQGESDELRQCGTWRKRWRDMLRKFDPDLVVVLTVGWDIKQRKLEEWESALGMEDPRFVAWMRSEYEKASELLSARNAQVVYLTAPCISGRATEVFESQDIQRFNDAVIRPLAGNQHGQVAVVDLFARVCEGGEAMDSLAGIPNARPDGVHFSSQAYAWIAGWLGPELEALAESESARER